jgi:hypothetical protein
VVTGSLKIQTIETVSALRSSGKHLFECVAMDRPMNVESVA